ncbi:MAG: hypothetical protein CMO81_02225 [Waddliaceae bacterium]|nr:hypothetical protein [Waddliaceae bacterium]
MLKKIGRVCAWLGIVLVLGPGTAIANEFDMVFLVGGVLLLSIGAVFLLTGARSFSEDRASSN